MRVLHHLILKYVYISAYFLNSSYIVAWWTYRKLTQCKRILDENQMKEGVQNIYRIEIREHLILCFPVLCFCFRTQADVAPQL